MFPLIYILLVKLLLLKFILVYLIDDSFKVIDLAGSLGFSEKGSLSRMIYDDSCFSIVGLVPECYIACVIHESLTTDVEFENRIDPFYLMIIMKL